MYKKQVRDKRFIATLQLGKGVIDCVENGAGGTRASGIKYACVRACVRVYEIANNDKRYLLTMQLRGASFKASKTALRSDRRN